MATKALAFLAFFALSTYIMAFATEDPTCVYTVYVRTGKTINGGTDSNISVQFYDSNGYYISIDNLVEWGGRMGGNADYFERGNLDVFIGLGDCLSGPICGLNLTSDGTGEHHGWYCNYVQVTSTGPHIPCNQHLFTVQQWLATDISPYQLTSLRDDCNLTGNARPFTPPSTS